MNLYTKLDTTFDKLWPIMRSITGPGFRESLDLIDIPFGIYSVKSGTQVDNWKIPPEWIFKSAYLIDSDGEVVVDAAVNNLHVVNYSEPMEGEFTLEELQPYLHSLPNSPTAIPYVTSYYKRTWGFCLSHNQRESLKPGKYQVKIDTSFNENGYLNYGATRIPGRTNDTIHFSSYLCHPSMANNELSGPLVLMGLYERIKNWPSRKYSYNFVINPETIGSIAYLNTAPLEGKMIAGFVLTCLGGKNVLSYKQSRSGSLADKLIKQSHWRIRPFTPVNGSDERQYNSPGFNLPVGQIARETPSNFPEYHTSLDTKESMGIDKLVEAIDEIEEMLKKLEIAGHYINQKPYGEPKLSDYGLYPTLSTPDISCQRLEVDRMMWILNYTDGKHDMLDIADKCGTCLESLRPVIEKLEVAGLIR